jgi:hypothetical protein
MHASKVNDVPEECQLRKTSVASVHTSEDRILQLLKLAPCTTVKMRKHSRL